MSYYCDGCGKRDVEAPWWTHCSIPEVVLKGGAVCTVTTHTDFHYCRRCWIAIEKFTYRRWWWVLIGRILFRGQREGADFQLPQTMDQGQSEPSRAGGSGAEGDVHKTPTDPSKKGGEG